MLKEKRKWRQQKLQALVEFQFKAISMQQAVTIIDTIHIVGILHAITSKTATLVRVVKRMRDEKTLLKARPNNSGLIVGEGSHFTTSRDPMVVHDSIPTRLCKEK